MELTVREALTNYGDRPMFGKKKAKAVADKLSARKVFDKLTRKKQPKAELSPEKIKKQSDSRSERRKSEPAV